jgi:hypothetical protein
MVLRGIAAALLLCGCIHRALPARLTQPAPISAALLMDGGEGIAALPPEVSEAVSRELSSRNLDPREVEAAQALGGSRNTQQRLALLSRADEAPFVLLLETRVVYYDELQGRFRWVVYARLSVARRDDLAGAASSDFEVPVFLVYEHDREAEALRAAAAIISDRTGSLLDSFFAAPPVKTGGGT